MLCAKCLKAVQITPNQAIQMEKQLKNVQLKVISSRKRVFLFLSSKCKLKMNSNGKLNSQTVIQMTCL